MANLTLKDTEAFMKLNRWERVLIGWKVIGRTGLTVQALCTLTERAQERTYQSMLKSPYTYVQYCSTVHAPVWCVQVMDWHDQQHGMNQYGPTTRHTGVTLTDMTNKKATYEPYVNMTTLLNEKFPYPEWNTVEKMSGMKSLFRIEPKMIGWLKAIAEGEYMPYDIQSYATFKL